MQDSNTVSQTLPKNTIVEVKNDDGSLEDAMIMSKDGEFYIVSYLRRKSTFRKVPESRVRRKGTAAAAAAVEVTAAEVTPEATGAEAMGAEVTGVEVTAAEVTPEATGAEEAAETPPPALSSLSPFEPTNLCVSIQRVISTADIYCFRYQTFPEIMSVISELMMKIVSRIELLGYSYYVKNLRQHKPDEFNERLIEITTGTSELLNLGIFMIKYTASNRRLLLYRIKPALIPEAFLSFYDGNSHFLSNTQFNYYLQNSDFNQLFSAIIKKVFFECLIKIKLNNVNFTQCFSLDLYPVRNRVSRQHLFHVDSVRYMDVSLFSLTYLLPPGRIIKGPTIVKHIGDRRVQLTLAVENGTTIAVNNSFYEHATPDFIVRTRHEDDEAEQSVYVNNRFNMYSLGKSSLPRTEFEKKKRQIHSDTSENTRSFIRTWFIRSFPADWPGESDLGGPGLQPDYPGLTLALEQDSTSLLCDTSRVSSTNNMCLDLKIYVERVVVQHIKQYRKSTSIVDVDESLTPEAVLIQVAPHVSLGGAKGQEQNNDTCSIVKKSTDANFEEDLEEILDSTENLIIGQLHNTIKGGLLIKKMRKNRKTRKIRKFKKTKKIRKINKKRKNMQSKKKRKYRK